MSLLDFINEAKSSAEKTIAKLDKLIQKRRKEHEGKISKYDIPLQDFEYLTPKEREEMHQAKLALPSSGELVSQAKQRIQARIKARKQK